MWQILGPEEPHPTKSEARNSSKSPILRTPQPDVLNCNSVVEETPQPDVLHCNSVEEEKDPQVTLPKAREALPIIRNL